MSEVVAYALKADFEGTVDIEVDGETQEVPVFQGGLLNVGDGDFDVAAALEDGAGVITVHADDQRLRDLLDVYPALKSTSPPAGAKPVSMYARRTLEELRNLGSVRDIKGAASLAKAKLISALEAQDKANRAGAARAAAAIAETPELADGLDPLSKDQLLELAEKHDVVASPALTKDEIKANLREQGVAADTTAEGGDA